MRTIPQTRPHVAHMVVIAILALGMFVLASSVSVSPDTRTSAEYSVPELPTPTTTIAPYLLDLGLKGVQVR